MKLKIQFAKDYMGKIEVRLTVIDRGDYPMSSIFGNTSKGCPLPWRREGKLIPAPYVLYMGDSSTCSGTYDTPAEAMEAAQMAIESIQAALQQWRSITVPPDTEVKI